MAEDSAPTDLLGDPLRPLPDPRGRRKLRFTREAYEKVEVLRAAGMTVEDIAKALAISVPTLRKYFFPELRDAVQRQKAEAFELLKGEARKGKVAAIKEWLQRLDAGDAAVPVAKTPPAPKLGKKAAAVAEAQTAHEDSEWGTLLN